MSAASSAAHPRPVPAANARPVPTANARPAAPAPEPARAGGRRLPFGRALAALVLPLSMVPVVLLAPSLFRAPVVLARHAAHALAPAHHRAVRRAPEGPLYYLVGPARLEIEAFESAAGALTPKVGVSPLDEPEWAARAATEAVGDEQPSVLLARGRETTDAAGRPLHGARAADHAPPSRPLPVRRGARARASASRGPRR